MVDSHFINCRRYRHAITKVSMLGRPEPGDDSSLADGVFQ